MSNKPAPDTADTETLESEARETQEREEPTVLQQILELVVTVAIAAGLAWGVRTWIAEGYRTPTESMVPTIQTSDSTLFSKITYRFREPRAGDIVTLDDPYGQLPMMMKRVIAVGGQTVDIRDGSTIVDGVVLDEPYVHGAPTTPGGVPMPVTVPEGCVWVMGDNRTNSKDSRWFGAVPVSTVHAVALVRYWPLDRLGVPDAE